MPVSNEKKGQNELIKGPATAEQLEQLKNHINPKWRVQQVGKIGEDGLAWLSCAAYIDSRNVQDQLDKYVGPQNWQSEFYSVNEKEFCKIGINCVIQDDGTFYQWIWKSDTGCESNPKNYKKALENLTKITPRLTAAHIPLLMDIANDMDQDKRIKGQTSDAFKRAAVHWGIGRNIYDTAMPKIKVKITDFAHNPSVGGIINEKVNLKYPDNLNSFLKVQMATRVSNPMDPGNAVWIS